MAAERQVDLPQLFSDVSRTISGISSIGKLMGSGSVNDADGSHSSGGSEGGGMSGLFGNTCFKACGMEDIQYAARSAGDMLISLRVCFIVLTVTLVVCLLLLTASVLYLVCKKAPPNRRFGLPAFVRDVFPQKDTTQIKDDVST